MLVAYGDRRSQMIDAFERIIYQLRDLAPPLGRASRFIDRRVKANFAGEHTPDGTPWAALEARYARRKAREVGEKPILQRRRALAIRTGQRGAVKSGGNMAVLQYGTDQPQGTWMQKFPVSVTDTDEPDASPIRAIRGPRRNDGPGGRVPPRQFLYLTDADCSTISEFVALHIGQTEGIH